MAEIFFHRLPGGELKFPAENFLRTLQDLGLTCRIGSEIRCEQYVQCEVYQQKLYFCIPNDEVLEKLQKFVKETLDGRDDVLGFGDNKVISIESIDVR